MIGGRFRNHLLYFFIGLLVGCFFTLLIAPYMKWTGSVSYSIGGDGFTLPPADGLFLEHLNERRHEAVQDGDGDDDDDENFVPFAVHKHEADESVLSKEIYDNVRVFCWIMTSRNNTRKKAIHVNATWAARCNKHVFMTSEQVHGLPTVDLNITEGRKYLWTKTKEAFKYIYNNELGNYEWFLKADDDTFVIVENLRFMLLAYSPDDPLYFGCKFKVFLLQGYMSGGAGYVLSREAVKRFVEDALTDSRKCKSAGTGAEDVELGKCLQNVGVMAGDSRDSQGRHRMLPFSPLSHLSFNHSMPKWFYSYMYYSYKQGAECCSDYMISFHYVTTAMMYTLDYLIYHVRPFGLLMDDFLERGGVKKMNGNKMLEYARQKSIQYSKPEPKPITVEEPEAVELKTMEKRLNNND
ncbi:Glycoprotein-N-acetylgalactosamine 3-beta-galactosyltransferase 1 [Toxocara canis]|uniref:Glycoprotein-N-acetylgalactosamine 3-beta-galactosyltransferase 1 n=2 Tax=Toxocara canis TaxID=6265 RepID=A0A0B2V4M6_TOXCA|nr:Glycoprotein-N-acetylgalactosamine 3-beta-galactosyltransferase 1 [Toxocara canis]VDM37955.1 unnamed protein product [Toxocara canis]